MRRDACLLTNARLVTGVCFVSFSLIVLACAPRDGGRSVADSASPARTCGVESATNLSGSGIGALRIGASVDAVRALCRVLRDTIALGLEALPQRTLLVDLGADSVTAEVDENRIWRLEIVHSVFRTADSLGVGSLVGALRTRQGVQVATGENDVFLTLADACGLSFRLVGIEAMTPPRLTAIADSVRVEEVLVVGCRAAMSPPRRVRSS